jgi:hypothetical protein
LAEPLDLIARLAALVPKPRINLIRYHGILAPHHALRAQLTPARRGRPSTPDTQIRTPAERHVAMTPDQVRGRLCEHCGGRVKIIAAIEDPAVIRHILDYLERREQAPNLSPPAPAPPPGHPPPGPIH